VQVVLYVVDNPVHKKEWAVNPEWIHRPYNWLIPFVFFSLPPVETQVPDCTEFFTE
jgi:hypothetical protein